MRATLLLAIMLAPSFAFAGDDWPDLQRPDNYKRPYQDKHSKSCCGPGDVVKTRFPVVPADNSYPEDAWYDWLREEWIRIPDDKIVADYAPDGKVMHVGSRSNLSSPGFDEILCFVRPKGGL